MLVYKYISKTISKMIHTSLLVKLNYLTPFPDSPTWIQKEKKHMTFHVHDIYINSN